MKIVYLSVFMPLLVVFSLKGQTTATAYSPPLGGIELSAGAYRETPVGIPLHRAAVVIAELVEVASPVLDDEGNFKSLRIFLDRTIGSPGNYNPNPSSGLPAYYLEIITGAASGERIPIAGSGENWIVIKQEPQGDLVAGVDSGIARDRVRIRPCWTPDTFMPASTAPLSAQSESADQVEMRDDDAIRLLGVWANSQHVLQRVDDSENSTHYWAEWNEENNRLLADDYGVLPGQVSWVRRANGGNIKWVVTGDVTTFDMTWAIPSPSSGELLEWPFSLTEPRAVTLDSSGLKSVLRTSTSAAERSDELVVWEDVTGFYSRPAKRFYLQSASPEPIWREVGDAVTNQGAYTLEPGKAYTIRRRGE